MTVPTDDNEVNADVSCSAQRCQNRGSTSWQSHESVLRHEVCSQQHGQQMDRYINTLEPTSFGDPLSS